MIANMGKEGKNISMDTLVRICETLDCGILDVIELASDEPSVTENRRNNRMDLNSFRDRLFDLLNDNEEMEITDLNADEQNSLIAVRTESGKVFEIVCREATDREDRWKNAD